MRQTIYVATLLIGLVATAPTSKEDKLVVTKNFFQDSLVVYTAQNDIVKILVPLNKLNYEDTDDTDAEDDGTIMFIVEAEKDAEGNQIDKGLSVLKKGVATKLLDSGRDAASDYAQNEFVYFGAKEGLFIYNAKTNEAEKYGPITDSIISLAKVNGSDILYVLTEANKLYKVTENGTQMDILDIENPQAIVLDYSNNLFFYNKEKEVYVKKDDKLTKIEGLPANPSQVTLMNPPFTIEDGVPVVVDSEVYIVYANGTSEVTELELQVKPTAYSMEGTLLQYYAYNKKIYEYNILALILSSIKDEITNFLQDKINEIQNIASRSKAELTASN